MTLDCPVCISEESEEIRKVKVSWTAGSKATFYSPAEPGEWEWESGCPHLADVSAYNKDALARIDEAIWASVDDDLRAGLEEWADAAREDRMFRRKFREED